MRRSLSHRYQQGQSQFQLEAISFFDDHSQVEGRSGAPHLAGFARSGDFLDFSAALSPCAVADPATSLRPSRCRTQEPISSYPSLRHKCSAVRG